MIPSLFDENLDPAKFASPANFVESLSLGKAQEVAARLQNDANPPQLVIGADTVVVLDSEVIGKPTSKEHARCILTR